MNSSEKYSLPPSNQNHVRIIYEFIRELLLTPIQSKSLDMPTYGFFDFTLKFLEMSKHFALLPHKVDPSVPREVVDERDIISASAKCGCLCRSPNVKVDYVQHSFAHIRLCREWKSTLIAELAHLTHANPLSFYKIRESDDDSFDYMYWSF